MEGQVARRSLRPIADISTRRTQEPSHPGGHLGPVPKTIQEIVDLADAAQLLCSAYSYGAVTRESAADLIRGGAGRLLEGQPEGSWLEAKSQEYDLTTTRGSIALAQAVARFCNAENGGLIVVGAQTKKTVGAETISKMRGFRREQADPRATSK